MLVELPVDELRERPVQPGGGERAEPAPGPGLARARVFPPGKSLLLGIGEHEREAAAMAAPSFASVAAVP